MEQGGKQAVRFGDWKGVRLNMDNDPEAAIELYDLNNDLGEQYNVASEHPEIVAQIATIMAQEHSRSQEFSFGYEKDQETNNP